NEKPKSIGRWIVLALQHVFAMFGATVLVPLLTGLDVGVALVASGIGTLIYIFFTKAKVPVYLGSSFAYIPAISAAVLSTAGATTAYVGLMVVGLIYAIIAIIIRFVGSSWLKKLLPPVVIGPMIIIIGLSLAPVAISSAGLSGTNDSYYTPVLLNDVEFKTEAADSTAGVLFFMTGDQLDYEVISGSFAGVFEDGDRVLAFASDPRLPENNNLSVSKYVYEFQDGEFSQVASDGWKIPIVAIITFLSVVFLSILAKGFLRIVPFLVSIFIGYLFAVIFGVVDITAVFTGYQFFQLPNFTFLGSYALDFSAVLMFAPIAFVTIAEHIGDHVVLGEITGNDFLEEPGLQNTLMGDGIATFVSAAIGGPANTTYGENTGVIAITKVGSVWVTGLAAVFAILLGFFGWIQAFINSIPWAVIGGMTIVLYGLISANGVKVLIKDKTDLGNMKNLVIVSTMLVIGLGGAVLQITSTSAFMGMSLAAVVGIILNFGLNKLEMLKKK
ncbi:MAG: solute carrier family 23 protein, partial [Acholeplasmataceae bacterium]|nr:solute carrier family 23 protein [Acholeplasmataceae bacterium]